MPNDISRSLVSLPYAPGCRFKPRTTGRITDSRRVYFYGGFVSLHIVLSGTGHISCNGKDYFLRRGDMFSLLPGIKVKYSGKDGSAWSFCWIDLTGPDAENLAQYAGFTKKNIIRTNLSFKEIIIDKFLHFWLLAMKNDDTAAAVYASLILDLIAFLETEHLSVRKEAGCLVKEFMLLLDDPQNLELNINCIAATLQVDRTTLFHACKKIKKLSPVKLLLKKKILFTKKLLLKYPDMPLSLLAEKTPFHHEKYLIEAFRRECGTTPSRFRETVKKNSSAKSSLILSAESQDPQIQQDANIQVQ